MSEATATTLAKGLDVGTSRIVLARAQQHGYGYDHQLNAFVSLPFSRMTEVMLRREGILYQVEGSQILAYGNRVQEFANILNGETRRPMQTGLLNPNEPKSLQMIELAIRELCGQAQEGERICFSVPCRPHGHESDVIYHERTIAQMLESVGYRVKSLNEGLAVVYSELESSSYTGLGLSFGGGMCNVCLAYLGLPVVTLCTVRAGDHIDRSAAAVTGETPTTIRLHKEAQFSFNGLSRNNLDQALSVYYSDMIREVVRGLQEALSNTRKLPKFDKALTVAVSGGSARAQGFLAQFERALREAKLPIPLAEVRLAEDPLNATAKGTLMAAMLDM
jgi:hypothetical protein